MCVIVLFFRVISFLFKEIRSGVIDCESMLHFISLTTILGQIRDYIHVMDLADGHVVALEKLLQCNDIGNHLGLIFQQKQLSFLKSVKDCLGDTILIHRT